MLVAPLPNQPKENWEAAVRWLRDQPGQEALVRAAYFDDPIDAAVERYWQSNEWEAVRTLIGRGPGRVLDVGAGRGIASYALARDGWTVAALEPDPSPLVGSGAIRDIAARQGLAIEVSDQVDPLAFPSASFDAIFARAVLHHIPDLKAAMREFFRVLKPGGLLVAAREHVLSDDADLPAFLAAHPLHHRYGGEMAYRLPIYIDAIASAGFKVETVIGSLDSPINYGPQTTTELADAMARQLVRVSSLTGIASLILRAPVIGQGLRRLATRVDRRPGRHASFVARRPA
ncbi:MAG: methyltransferase domain-containing protein [Sphingomonadaceae bacterium]